jgi:hypothetical protein
VRPAVGVRVGSGCCSALLGRQRASVATSVVAVVARAAASGSSACSLGCVRPAGGMRLGRCCCCVVLMAMGTSRGGQPTLRARGTGGSCLEREAEGVGYIRGSVHWFRILRRGGFGFRLRVFRCVLHM